MKHIVFVFILSVLGTLQAQVSKTVEPTQAGTLSSYFTQTELTTVASLTLKGKVDARDFAFMRDKLKTLNTLNMSLATIYAYSGSLGTVQGTSTNYPAGEIPAYAFYNPVLLTYKSSLVTVTLPVNAVSIGTQAFYFCWNITSLNIPNTLKKIDDYAFYGCYALSSFSATSSNTRFSTDQYGILYNKAKDTLFLCPNARTGSLILPTTVRHIDNSAFENCYNLTLLTLPSTLVSIGSYAFAYCSGISGSLTLPAALTTVGDGAFYGCNNLTGTVTLPASLTQLGSFSFFESYNIQAFSVHSSNSRFSSFNGMLMSKQADTLFICPAGKSGSISLPESVKLIGSYAMYGCNKLTGTLNIPSGTDYIGYYALNGCTGLQGVSVSSLNNWFTAENGVLYSKIKDRVLFCPSGYTGTFSFPDQVVSIDPGAFYSCTGISGYVHFPASLSWIGEYAFYNCPGIVGFEAATANPWFSTDEGLLLNKNADTLYICPLSKTGHLTLPASVRHIGDAAFTGCINLTAITAGPGLQSIGSAAFAGCTAIKTMYFPSDVNSIGYSAFYNCAGLTQFSIARPSPPLVDYYTFDLVNQNNAQLMVSTGAKQSYEQAPYWQNFQTISETSFGTPVTVVNGSALKITATISGILVSGIPVGERYAIYTPAGKQLVSSVAYTNSNDIRFPYKGIFILKTDCFTEKFIR